MSRSSSTHRIVNSTRARAAGASHAALSAFPDRQREPGDGDGELVSLLVHEQASRLERSFSIARALFCLVVLARLCALPAQGADLGKRTLAEAPILLVTIALSLWMAHRAHTGEVSRRMLRVSVVLDAAACSACLGANVLWPWPDYPGLLRLPDAMVIPFVTVTAGLRLSVRLAVLGGAANLACFAALIRLDSALNQSRIAYTVSEVFLYGLYVLSSAAVAVMLARSARRLAMLAAAESARATRARRGLDVVLRDNHDARSVLGAAALRADLLASEVELARGGTLRGVRCAAGELQRDLVLLAEQLGVIREHASSELAATAALEQASVDQAANRVAELLSPRFGLNIRWISDGTPLYVFLAGGQRNLERALMNIVLNACEGDGQTHAEFVFISSRRTEKSHRVVILIEDDGPGVPEALWNAGKLAGFSTKLQGSGVGLSIVSAIVEASQGKLRIESREGSGTRVSLELLSVLEEPAAQSA